MNIRIICSSILFFFASCSSKNEVLMQSKYETIYSVTINKEDFIKIHKILKTNFSDFDELGDGKIKYIKNNERYFLKIYLRESHFKLIYRSNIGYDDEIEKVKSEIEQIK